MRAGVESLRPEPDGVRLGLSGIRHRYGSVVALDDVTLDALGR